MKPERSAFLFFLVVFGFALPIWLVSDKLGVIGSLRIPTSDLALAFTPMLVGLGLSASREGWRSARSLLGRAVDVTSIRPRGWIVCTALLPPTIYLTAFGLMHLSGADHHLPAFDAMRFVGLLVLFLVLAAGEEIGWMGYAFEPLRQRWGPLAASIILAGPWWLGHLPSMAAIGASKADMAWWMVGALGLRIVMSWLYNCGGGSLFAMVLFHALLNLSRISIFPVVGSHYVGAYQAVSYAIVGALAIALVMVTRGRLGAPRSCT